MNEMRRYINIIENAELNEACEHSADDFIRMGWDISSRGRWLDKAKGNLIGHGKMRCVWKFGSRKVIKSETYDNMNEPHQNPFEWATWNAIQHDDLSKYFVPCVEISPCEFYLVQMRAQPLKTIPEHLPSFMRGFDTQLVNFGTYDDHPVMVDYGASIGALSINSMIEKWGTDMVQVWDDDGTLIFNK